MKQILFVSFLLAADLSFGQRFPRHEISLNAFRNPSIGLEYRLKQVSVHAGYYPTIISQDGAVRNVTTSFIRTGFTYWFGPVGRQPNPSSFYVSASYVRGLNRDYAGDNGGMGEAGFRWFVWRGLNVRLGAAVLVSPGHVPRLNPTPGISYAILL